MNPKLVLTLTLGLVTACGNDREVVNGKDSGVTEDAATSSGDGGGGGGSGGRGAGGRGTGGAPASGGSGGTAGGAGGMPFEAGPDAGDGALPKEAGPSPEPLSGTLLVAGTDYFSTTEVATVDLATGNVLGRSTFPDGDAVPRASGGRGFVLERTLGAVDVLSASGTVARRIPLAAGDAGGAGLNPHAVVVVPGADGGTKAYVSLYAGNAIAVLDLESGARTGTIDLSALMDPADTDGSVDVDQGFYDAATGRSYFVLARVDLNSLSSAPYQLGCPGVPALLVAIDPATDALVPAEGGAPGIPLGLVFPTDVAIDTAGGRALVLSNGCFEPGDAGASRIRFGVEAVDLATGRASILLTPTAGENLNRLVLLGPDAALVEQFDANYASQWSRWSPSSPTLGNLLTDVPMAPVAAAPDSLVGVSVTTVGDGGARVEVLQYRVSTRTQNTLTISPWAAPLTSVGGVALVK